MNIRSFLVNVGSVIFNIGSVIFNISSITLITVVCINIASVIIYHQLCCR